MRSKERFRELDIIHTEKVVNVATKKNSKESLEPTSLICSQNVSNSLLFNVARTHHEGG